VRGIRTYQNVDRHTSVIAANPMELVLLTYEALIRRLKQAEEAFAMSDVAARGEAVSRALEVIEKGLVGALDMNGGGELAKQLMKQYQLWSIQLLRCNLNADPELLGAVINQVVTVRSAWEELKLEAQRERALG